MSDTVLTGQAEDEQLNNIMAAGGVFMALTTAGVEADVELDGNNATNRLVVVLPFLKSPYRLTVERIPDEDGDS